MYTIFKKLPPLLWHTLFLIIGIITQYYNSTEIVIIIIGIATLILCWFSAYYASVTKKGIIYICVFTLGCISMYQQQHYHTFLINKYSNQSLYCLGTITQCTQLPHTPLKHKVTIALESVSSDSFKKNDILSGYSLIVQTNHSLEHLIGARVTCNNILIKTGSASFSLFCMRNKILGIAHTPTCNLEVISLPKYSFIKYLHKYKKNMIEYFKKHMSPQTFTFFATLFLGNTDLTKKTVKPYKKSFQSWGIMHYLARSGLHLVIITLFLEYIILLIPWKFWMGRIVIMVCTILYGILTWPSLSFYRACITFLLIQIARIAKKAHYFLHVLTLVGFCCLLLNPILLFFLDFQLTFGITLSLCLYSYTR